MSKKVPEDEMLLAKLIQNAKSKGFGWCSGALFLTSYDDPRPSPTLTTNRCCALGAASLDPKTSAEIEEYGLVAYGNDNAGYVRWYQDSIRPSDGETLGYAFRLAMKESDDE